MEYEGKSVFVQRFRARRAYANTMDCFDRVRSMVYDVNSLHAVHKNSKRISIRNVSLERLAY